MLVSKKLLNYFLDLDDISDKTIVKGLISLGIDFEKTVSLSPLNNNLIIGKLINYTKSKATKKLYNCTVKIGSNKQVNFYFFNDTVDDISLILNEKILLLITDKTTTPLSKLKNNQQVDAQIGTFKNLNITYKKWNSFIILDKKLDVGSIINPKYFEDTIFIFSNPSNRPDLNAVAVLAHELSVKLDTEYLFPKIIQSLKNFPSLYQKPDVNFNVNLKTKKCSQVIYQLIELKNNFRSKLELQILLLNNNITPNNFISDIATIASFIGGSPIQVYDFKKITSPFNISFQRTDEWIQISKENKISLNQGIVIKNKQTPIALAGLNLNYKCAATLASDTFLFEYLELDPLTVKNYFVYQNKNSNSMYTKHFIHSFHYQLTNSIFIYFLRRYLRTFTIYSPWIFIHSLHRPIDKNQDPIILNLNKAEQVINCKLDQTRVRDLFYKLNFKIKKLQSKDVRFKITPPVHRLDVKNENDLFEEIIRFLVDLNKVESLPPSFDFIPYQQNYEQLMQSKTRNFFLANNFTEVVTYSLVSNECSTINFFNFLIPLKIKNKTVSKYYRLSLFHFLFQTLVYNLANKINHLNIFEISDIYYQASEIKIVKNTLVSTISYGEWINTFSPVKKTQIIDTYLLKSIYKNYCKFVDLDINKLTVKPFFLENKETIVDLKKYFKSGIFIYYNNILIGIIGQVLISNALSSKIDLFQNAVIFTEFNLSLIEECVSDSNNKEFVPFPSVPSIDRDFSFFLKSEEPWKPVNETLDEINKILKNVLQYKFKIKLIDLFKPSTDNLSYSIRITIYPIDETFSRDKIKKIEDKVIDVLTKKLNYLIR
ncbi:phenylalanine--tRNA ligase beta subunit-related protein [Mycoplasma sp. SG1]|uniref:phenylalanine--tRNA ligase beta subunit-related protein n=1 Tax=Mycoplasma sp. SG1 TaxID=2810348 RepID=UPI00202494CF|nr:phenylalanine--tRNA ligase beta subunit-related protein [Mycoplasma sp. SG1]URM53189.1 hypothetical protein JRW51_02470 [Mycoplasma sp. SG1]